MIATYLCRRQYIDTGKCFLLRKRKRFVSTVSAIITISKFSCLLEQTKQIKTQMYSAT